MTPIPCITSTTLGLMNVADIQCPDDPQGRTYRQINAEKKHSIPLGALVEYYDGVRLFVVARTRDCDQTPLYWLSPDKKDIPPNEHEQYIGTSLRWVGGCLEDSLTVIKPPSR